ncbi:Pre-mRNA-splicing factor PRP46 [Bienertia sinuspersici]
MAETPQNNPIAKLTAMLETLSTRLDTLEKTTPNTTKTLEKLVQKATDQYAYHESPDSDIQLPAKLREKFSATDLSKFKPSNDPRFHLKGFRATMTIKRVDPVLYPKVFPLSLDPVCKKWFFSLSDKDTATWEDITHAPMKATTAGNSNYSNNNKKTDTPSSSKGVNAVEIDAVETTRAPPRRPRHEYTPLGMTYTQAFDRLKSKGALSPIGPTADPPAERRSPRWDPNKYYKYHQGKGHTTEECWTLKNKL